MKFACIDRKSKWSSTCHIVLVRLKAQNDVLTYANDCGWSLDFSGSTAVGLHLASFLRTFIRQSEAQCSAISNAIRCTSKADPASNTFGRCGILMPFCWLRSPHLLNCWMQKLNRPYSQENSSQQLKQRGERFVSPPLTVKAGMMRLRAVWCPSDPLD